jgi:hypothetical protein
MKEFAAGTNSVLGEEVITETSGCTMPGVPEGKSGGMRRKIQIVLANTFLVAALVCSGSYVYVSQTLSQRVMNTHETANHLNSQLAYVAASEISDSTSRLGASARDPVKVRDAIADHLAINLDLNTMLESVVSTWPMIYDAAIVDANGKAILHTNPDLIGKTVPDRPDFQIVQDAKFRRQLDLVYNPPTVYEVRLPLQLNGEPFGSVRLGLSTVFLKYEITPRLRQAATFSGISILLSLLLAAGLSYIALGPTRDTGGDEHGLVALNIAHP